jgi:hypothetical protein
LKLKTQEVVMGSPQGLAKYQSRRIGAVSTSSNELPKKPLFNQVPSAEPGEGTYVAQSGLSPSDTEQAIKNAPPRTLTRQPVSAKQVEKLDKRMIELATRYVEIFQEQTTAGLNSAEKSALILEVAVFYSHPTRTGRLENLVTALDNAPH